MREGKTVVVTMADVEVGVLVSIIDEDRLSVKVSEILKDSDEGMMIADVEFTN